jgi:hypothetical protein
VLSIGTVYGWRCEKIDGKDGERRLVRVRMF